MTTQFATPVARVSTIKKTYFKRFFDVRERKLVLNFVMPRLEIDSLFLTGESKAAVFFGTRGIFQAK